MKNGSHEAHFPIHVTGRHVLVTEAMKEYAIDKLNKIEKFSDRIIGCHVAMDIQKLEHRVDVVLKYSHFLIKAHAVSENMYASIDKVADKLQNIMRKYKGRMQEHQAKGHKILEMNVDVLSMDDSVDDLNDAIAEENEKALEREFSPHKVVKTEKMPLKLLNTDEAVMKMDLSQEPFMVFKHETDGKIRVIYRREDRNYGLIAIE